MGMTQQTLKYNHKRRSFCKAEKAEPEKTPEPEPQNQRLQKILQMIILSKIRK